LELDAPLETRRPCERNEKRNNLERVICQPHLNSNNEEREREPSPERSREGY